jgi:hypothetical protein
MTLLVFLVSTHKATNGKNPNQKKEKKMAYPYPVIVFQVDLSLPTAEAMGASNAMQGTDSPDNIVDATNQTTINSLKAARPSARTLSLSLPYLAAATASGLAVKNGNIKHGDLVIAAGRDAINLRKMYCNVANGGEASYDKAVLTVSYIGAGEILPT